MTNATTTAHNTHTMKMSIFSPRASGEVARLPLS
jgi:hypothetical protein